MPWIVCIVLALLIGGLRIGPPLLSPESYLIGGWGHPDNLGNHWLLVWVAEQISTGQSILHNTQYFWPVGDYPWLAGNGSEGLLFVPLYWLFGWPAGVVPLVLFYFVGIGLGGYCLGRVMGAGPWLSLIPSSMLVSTPYWTREMNAGRFSQLDGVWLIGSLVGFIWLIQQKEFRWKPSILVGILVGLTGIFYWYYAFFFVLSAIIVVSITLLYKRLVLWKNMGVAATMSLLTIAPIALIFWSHWNLIPGVDEVQFPSPDASTDALNIGGEFFSPHGKTAGVVLSIPTVVLSLYSMFRWRVLELKSRWFLVIGLSISFFFLTLSLGPKTPLFEWVYGLATPLRRFWWPSRHLLMWNIGMAIIATVGLKRVKRERWVASICTALVPISLWIQGDRPFHAAHTPLQFPIAEYEDVKKLSGSVIWSPPINPKVYNTQLPLLFQMVHKKKLLTGHALWVDRVRPAEWDEQIANHRLLSCLQRYELGGIDQICEFEAQSIIDLQSMGIDLVVLDSTVFPRNLMGLVPKLASVYEELFGSAIYRGDGIRVWSTANWTGVEKIRLPDWKLPKGTNLGDGRHRMPGSVLGRGVQP